MESLRIGLDVHDRETEYAVVGDDGRVLKTGRIPTERDALKELAHEFAGATFVMEASSVHEWVYDTLQAARVAAKVVHPVKIKDVTGKKNDKVDAKFLAAADRLGMLRGAYVPPKDIRALRELTRYRTFLTHERTRLKNRVHGVLKRRGVRITNDDDIAVRDVFAKRVRAKLDDVDHPEIKEILQIIDDFSRRIAKAERDIAKHARRTPAVRNLVTIPGLGNFTSLALYAEIDDINRFPTPHALAAYFGLVPSRNQSGDTSVNGRITKKGSRIVRWLLTQAAWAHVGAVPKTSFAKDYEALKRRIGAQKAITAICRKLVVCAWHIIKEERSFRSSG